MVQTPIFHSFINGIPVALAITDSDDKVVDINDAFCKLLECEKDDLLGRNILHTGIIDDDLINKFSMGLKHTGKLDEYLISFTTKTKEVKSAAMSIHPVSELGNGFNVVTINHITAEKKVKETISGVKSIQKKGFLIEQENANNLLYTLLHSIPIMVCWKDRDSHYLGANHLFMDIVHLPSLDQLVGKTDEELFGVDRAIKFNEYDHEVITSGKAKVFYEETFLDTSGNEGWLMKSKTPIRNNEGEVVGILVTGQNITEKKRFDIELKESESKYRSLFENMTSGFILNEMIYDADGNPEDYRFIEINPAFEKIVNTQPSTFIGKTAKEVIPKEMYEVINLFGQVAKTGVPVNYEMYSNGKWYELHAFSPKYDYFAIVFNDITERKKAEEEINRKNEELTKINKELDKFVYSASHDLRAPIATLLGLIEAAKISKNRNDIDLYLEKQKITLKKMDDFIHEIVNYSRNDRLEISREAIDLKKLVEDLFEQYNYINNASYVRKTLQIHEDILFYSDRQRISVILSNLISNGLKYADLRKPDPFLLIDINIKPEQVTILVEDNGEGILPDYRDRVFEMFLRASTNSTGSGLGLYIVKEVLEKLGGTIEVHSEFGKGTVFTVSIPNLAS